MGTEPSSVNSTAIRGPTSAAHDIRHPDVRHQVLPRPLAIDSFPDSDSCGVGFLSLPRELRDKIYKLCLSHRTGHRFLFKSRKAGRRRTAKGNSLRVSGGSPIAHQVPRWLDAVLDLQYSSPTSSQSSRPYCNNGSEDVRRSEYEEEVGHEEREEMVLTRIASHEDDLTLGLLRTCRQFHEETNSLLTTCNEFTIEASNIRSDCWASPWLWVPPYPPILAHAKHLRVRFTAICNPTNPHGAMIHFALGLLDALGPNHLLRTFGLHLELFPGDVGGRELRARLNAFKDTLKWFGRVKVSEISLFNIHIGGIPEMDMAMDSWCPAIIEEMKIAGQQQHLSSSIQIEFDTFSIPCYAKNTSSPPEIASGLDKGRQIWPLTATTDMLPNVYDTID